MGHCLTIWDEKQLSVIIIQNKNPKEYLNLLFSYAVISSYSTFSTNF